MAESLNSVEAKVRYIVEQQWKPSADYMFGNWAQANVGLDQITQPVVYYVMAASGSLYPMWNQTCDRPSTLIGFLAKTDFDFDPKENDALMQSMKELAVNFILEVNKSGLFEKIPEKTEIPYQAVYDKLNVNVTGIMISITLKEVDGIKHCPI